MAHACNFSAWEEGEFWVEGQPDLQSEALYYHPTTLKRKSKEAELLPALTSTSALGILLR